MIPTLTPIVALLATACEPAPYLALGDSYTIGEGVAVADRWTEQLTRKIRTGGGWLDRPQTIARTGWTVTDLDRGIDAADPQGPFRLVTLLIGVNDQFRGGSAATYRPALRAQIQRAIAFASAPCKVVVVSIPDYGVTPFGQRMDPARIAREIDAFNAVGREEAAAAQVTFVDITDISRRAPEAPELLARDGLHPSGRMYAAWAERVAPEALRSLRCED